jgi:hypothetical protein
MWYRKKPVVIEARLWDGKASTYQDFRLWGIPMVYDIRKPGPLLIVTLEGNMEASLGDYIIQGVQGEFYPCKPDIFEATYEKVEG